MEAGRKTTTTPANPARVTATCAAKPSTSPGSTIARIKNGDGPINQTKTAMCVINRLSVALTKAGGHNLKSQMRDDPVALFRAVHRIKRSWKMVRRIILSRKEYGGVGFGFRLG